MSLRALLRRFLLPILLPVSITSLIYIYLYPLFHGSSCAFPLPTYSSQNATAGTGSTTPFLHTLLGHLNLNPNNTDTNAKAPFRLLIIADPQLEGDTSLPHPSDTLLPKLSRYYTDILNGPSKYTSRGTREHTYTSLIKNTLRTLLREDVPTALRAGRKRVDLWGNDYYLGHVFRTVRWWAGPTHVTVLGDLLGSQWVEDGEFEDRGRRYWGRVFGGMGRVEDDVTEGEGEVLGEDEVWERRVINVAGNHDVGYAGDISGKRMERFERVFGRANWDVKFRLDGEGGEEDSTVPTLHMVVLNSLILDTPALDKSIQDETYKFLNSVIDERAVPLDDGNSSSKSFTLLLTHVPLHKRAGICTDAPYFGYYEKDDEDFKKGEEEPCFRAGGLREQNHLSDHISQKGILEGVFGMSGDGSGVARGRKGRNGLILTGHDHTGCDVVHYVDRPSSSGEEGDATEEQEKGGSWTWDARRYTPSSESESEPTDPSIREVTLRSMMGEYGGNAGFLSVWFDPDPSVQEWRYEISTCMFGVQHIWWGVHVVAVVSGVLSMLWVVLEVRERGTASASASGRERLGVKKRQ